MLWCLLTPYCSQLGMDHFYGHVTALAEREGFSGQIVALALLRAKPYSDFEDHMFRALQMACDAFEASADAMDYADDSLETLSRRLPGLVTSNSFLMTCFDLQHRCQIIQMYQECTLWLKAMLCALHLTRAPAKTVQCVVATSIDKYRSGSRALSDTNEYLMSRIQAQIVIARHWHKARSDPAYELCRNRLRREFEELAETS